VLPPRGTHSRLPRPRDELTLAHGTPFASTRADPHPGFAYTAPAFCARTKPAPAPVQPACARSAQRWLDGAEAPPRPACVDRHGRALRPAQDSVLHGSFRRLLWRPAGKENAATVRAKPAGAAQEVLEVLAGCGDSDEEGGQDDTMREVLAAFDALDARTVRAARGLRDGNGTRDRKRCARADVRSVLGILNR